MVVAPAALLVAIGASPGGEPNRLVRIFVKRLLEELRTRQAMMHPEGLAAALTVILLAGETSRSAWGKHREVVGSGLARRSFSEGGFKVKSQTIPAVLALHRAGTG